MKTIDIIRERYNLNEHEAKQFILLSVLTSLPVDTLLSIIREATR